MPATNRPAGAPTRLATAPGPALTYNQALDWTIPSDWITKLNSGEAGGIGCYVASTNPYLGLTTANGGMTITAPWSE